MQGSVPAVLKTEMLNTDSGGAWESQCWTVLVVLAEDLIHGSTQSSVILVPGDTGKTLKHLYKYVLEYWGDQARNKDKNTEGLAHEELELVY